MKTNYVSNDKRTNSSDSENGDESGSDSDLATMGKASELPRTPKVEIENSVLSNLTSKNSSSGAKKKSKKMGGFGGSFMASIIDLTKEDPAIIEEEIQERQQKRRHEQERHELELAKLQKQMEFEERRLIIEERKLSLEEAKNAVVLNAMNKL